MAKRSYFWILLTILSVGGIIYFINNYSTAFPALSIDIKMNREMALEKAKNLAEKYNLSLDKYREAVSFDGERNFQTFVELEGGGLDSFSVLYLKDIYHPYKWRVRHFQEKNPKELTIWFTPAGKPYSFSQKLSEETPGSSIDRDSAFSVAMEGIKDEWSFDISLYELIDESKKIQPGGRTDHSFTFERSGYTIGENGYIRLKLTVQGDMLGELLHFPHVPESFNRRFSEIRSANDTIAFSATIAVFLIYGLLGVVVSIFFLMREKRVLWRKALFWGMIVGFFQVLVQFNYFPMMWMDYNTAVTESSFMMEMMVQLVLLFVLQSSLYTLSFIAAESLTRKAFPNQLQFWKLWSRDVASSTNVLGQTLGGYLATGIFMFYAIAFYTFVTKNLGWWAPADTNYNPNLLAAYFPWLTSIGISLGAGFWEECLFRAVPLAGAALIGDKFGKRNLCIGISFVLQAIIFGAAHANYPVQPAYARLIELMIPSFLFGYIYLRYGLLPGIIMHYAYDVVMISLQLFIADVPGIIFQRIMVIIFLFIPVWVILFYRFKSKRWVSSLTGKYNSDWVPPVEKEEPEEVSPRDNDFVNQSNLITYKNILLVGIAGLLFWISTGSFEVDQPRMEITKSKAIEVANTALEDYGFKPDSQWTMEARHNSWEAQGDRFIWQEKGKEAYYKLRGKYLGVPAWEIRYRKYFGDVAQRAEQFSCYVNPTGEKTNIWHMLPESRYGDTLSEEEARAVVSEHIINKYNIELDMLQELEANSSKKPNRMDWNFIFEDTTTYKLDEGKLQISVYLSGNQVTGSNRFVFVPEEWKREEEGKKSRWNPAQIILGLVKTFSLAYILMFGAIRWTKKEFNVRLFSQVFCFLLIIGLIDLWSDMPNMLYQFKTELPYGNQLYQMILMSIVGLLFGSLFKAIIISASQSMISHIMPTAKDKTIITFGIYIGIFFIGISSVLISLYPTLGPKLGYWWPLNDKIPLWGQVFNSLSGFINIFIDILSITLCLGYITHNLTKRLPLGGLYIFLIGLAITSQNRGAYEMIHIWIIAAIIFTILYLFTFKEILRFYPQLIPIIAGTITILNKLTLGFPNLYNGQFFGACISSAIVAWFAYYCWGRMQND